MITKLSVTTLNNRRGLHLWAMALAVLFLVGLTGKARAQSVTNTIYMDGFARVGQLVGSSPDTVNAGGATWIGANFTNSIITDGTEAATTNKLTAYPWANAWLPFNLETGHVYTVSCSMFGVTNDNQQWIAMGFSFTPGVIQNLAATTTGVGWVLDRCSNNGCQFFAGPSTANATTVTYPNMGSFINLSVALNTATNPTKWSVSYYTNGVYVNSFTYATIPTADNGIRAGYVGLSETSNARGYFRNFSLTDTIPSATLPNILEQPSSLTALQGRTATFWINAIALPDPTYQWQTNNGSGWVSITGATNATYTTPPLSIATYNGLQYQVIATTAAGSVTSSAASLTVNAGQPSVFSAEKSLIPTNVIVMFSGPVDPTTGLAAGNYSLNNGASVVAASPGVVPGSVVLQTSSLNGNSVYFLTVKNVRDLFNDTIVTTNVSVLPAGLVVYLRGDSGIELDGSGNVAQWLDQTTNGNNAQQFFGMNPAIANLYVASTQARPTMATIGLNNIPSPYFTAANDNYMTVPYSPTMAVSGSFTVFTFASPADFGASRDILNENVGNIPAGFDLQVSSGTGAPNLQLGEGDYNSPPPASGPSLALAAHFWAFTTQNIGTNAANSLATNSTAFYVDGTLYGGHTTNINIEVPSPANAAKPLYIGWRQDHNGSIWNGQIGEQMLFNRVISGADLTNLTLYFAQKYYPVVISPNFTANTTTTNGYMVTYNANASEGPISSYFSYQWMENGTNIPGATNATFITQILGPGNSNTTYDVQITEPNGSIVYSITNTLAVIPGSPYVTGAGIPLWDAANPTNLVVVFNKAVDPVTGTVAGNYTLSSGTVLSAAIGAEPNKVILTTSGLPAWNVNPGTYSVQVQNVQDLYGSTIVTASTPIVLYPIGTALWLKGNAGVVLDSGGNPLFPGYASVNEWDDQSGNGADLYQNSPVVVNTSAALEPLYTTNYHGNVCLQFAGTNLVVYQSKAQTTFLSSLNASANDYPCVEITNDLSIISVVTFNTLVGGTNGEIVGKTGFPNANQPAPYDYSVGTADAVILRGDGTNNTSFTSTNVSTSVGYPHIVVAMQQGTTLSHFLDGTPVGNGTVTKLEPYLDQGQPLSIGQRGDVGHNRLNGQMFELILIPSALDSSDLASLNNYLVAKYDIPTGANGYPVITQQPVASTNVNSGGELIVPTVVTGNPLALQWYDTNNIAQVGQTSATLDILNDTTSDSYYLVATNIFNAVTSSIVAVTVDSGPAQILIQPANPTYATLGGAASISVGAYGTAPLTYQWQFYNGSSWVNLANNGRIVGSQSSALNITNVLVSDVGSYQVVVANLSTSITSSVANLNIIGVLPVTFYNGQQWFLPSGSSDARFANNELFLTTNNGSVGEGQASYFFQIPQYVGAFQASFTYRAGYGSTLPLADGIAFVLQDDPRGTSAIGTAGGELCVGSTGGTQITPSVELELNIYPGNGLGGVGYALDDDGVVGNVSGTGAVNLTNAVGTLGPGDPITVNMLYANGQMALTFTDLVAATSFSTNVNVGSIPAILGNNTAYIGFTAACGGDNANQNITNFTFVSIPQAYLTLTNGQVSVSWPGSVLGYTLQQSPNIQTPSWQNVNSQVILTNNLNYTITSTNGSSQFYRLILFP